MINDKDGFEDAGAVVASGVTGDCTWELSGEAGEYTLVIGGEGATKGDRCRWDKWRDGIKTVVIGGGVRGIDGRVFEGYKRLTSFRVDVANGRYRSVDGVLFDKKGRLLLRCQGRAGDYVVPGSVTGIGRDAFRDCGGLTSVTIPASVTKIDTNAFDWCSGLTSIHVDVANRHYSSAGGVLLDKKGTKLLCCPQGKGGDYAIPGTVTAIGYGAFADCRELTGVGIPDSVTAIGNSAFHNCGKLGSVTIPGSVTRIGSRIFWDCGSLTSVTIRGAVTKIDDMDMFQGCSALTSVTIPASVTKIDTNAFDGCRGLTSIQVDAENRHYSSVDGVLFNKGGKKLLCYPRGKEGDYTIPARVTAIGEGVFVGRRWLNFIHVEAANTRFSSADGVLFNKNKSKLICCPARKKGDYVIPGTVTEIGERAFWSCNGLIFVTIPDSVVTIGSHAFTLCALTTVTIPDSVVTVGEWAFGLNELTSVTIGKSMTGDYLFWDCEDLISIRVDAANAQLCSEDGVLFDKEKKTLLCYPGGRAGDYAIPGSVTAIGDYAFEGCKGLTSVVIPGSVTAIGDCAFEGCTGLTSVVISDSVTAIGRNAFNSCVGLTSVTIPGSVTAIGDGAFNSCFGLTSVVIPGSVTTIGDLAFYNCHGLTSVVIPGSVTTIGRDAFWHCSELTSVVIPGSVTTIGESAFGYSSLSTFTNFSLVPQEIDRCFDNVDVDVCTLRVPAGAVGTYKAAAGWGEFGKIVAI